MQSVLSVEEDGASSVALTMGTLLTLDVVVVTADDTEIEEDSELVACDTPTSLEVGSAAELTMHVAPTRAAEVALSDVLALDDCCSVEEIFEELGLTETQVD